MEVELSQAGLEEWVGVGCTHIPLDNTGGRLEVAGAKVRFDTEKCMDVISLKAKTASQIALEEAEKERSKEARSKVSDFTFTCILYRYTYMNVLLIY